MKSIRTINEGEREDDENNSFDRDQARSPSPDKELQLDDLAMDPIIPELKVSTSNNRYDKGQKMA